MCETAWFNFARIMVTLLGIGWLARANSFARGASDGPAQSKKHRQTSLAVPPGECYPVLNQACETKSI